MDGKQATSFRISAEALRLLTAISKRLGITRTAAIEVIIRDAALRLNAQTTEPSVSEE